MTFDLIKCLGIYTDERYDACVRGVASLEIDGSDYRLPIKVKLNSGASPNHTKGESLVVSAEDPRLGVFLPCARTFMSDSISDLIAFKLDHKLELKEIEAGTRIIRHVSVSQVKAELDVKRPDRSMNRILLDKQHSQLWRYLTFDYRARKNAAAIIYALFAVELEVTFSGPAWAKSLAPILTSDFGLRNVKDAEVLFALISLLMERNGLKRSDFDYLLTFISKRGRPLTIGTPRLASLRSIFPTPANPEPHDPGSADV